MTSRTEGIWNIVDAEAEDAVIYAHLLECIAQGQTDGVAEETLGVPVPGQKTIIRTWAQQEFAQQWIDFLNALGTPPISYVILPN